TFRVRRLGLSARGARGRSPPALRRPPSAPDPRAPERRGPDRALAAAAGRAGGSVRVGVARRRAAPADRDRAAPSCRPPPSRERPAGDPREISDAIEWDHDRLDRLESTAFDAWGAGDAIAAETAFRMFAHGLRRHIAVEEALLFPEFERRTGLAPKDGPTGTL